MQLKSCEWKGYSWQGEWFLQGNPDYDLALGLLFRAGLPSARGILSVHMGCGAWLSLVEPSHTEVVALHDFWEDAYAFQINAQLRTGLRAQALPFDVRDVASYPWDRIDTIMFRMRKDMDWCESTLNQLEAQCPSGTSIHVLGSKNEGIRNMESRLLAGGREIEAMAIGNHSRWITWKKTKSPDQKPSLDSLGTFASGRIDAGTALLLKVLPPCQGLRVCDLGCGEGYLAKASLKAGASRVVAIDHQYQAILQTKRLLATDGARAEVVWTYLDEGIVERFDRIVSHPPFHLEFRRHDDLGESWLAACRRLLAPRGEIWIVANRFLDYSSFAAKHKLACEAIQSDKSYTVWRLSPN